VAIGVGGTERVIDNFELHPAVGTPDGLVASLLFIGSGTDTVATVRQFVLQWQVWPIR
jgi:hypothetical protein